MRLKRSTRQIILFIILGVALVATTVATLNFLYVKQLKEGYELKLTLATNEIEDNTRLLYVAKEEIKRNEAINKENLEQLSLISELDNEYYITEDDIGKIALVDIPGNIPILKNMVAEYIQDDLREEEFNVFYLNTNLKDNDYVDIRIVYPNGENYIVLSKKSIKNVSIPYSNCFMWLDANEIHYISSAIVDAYLNEGTKLYTTKYIEPNLQEASKVTYTPNLDVIDVINSDPNVINRAMAALSKEVRENIDNRLNSFYMGYNGEVQWQESIPIIEEEVNVDSVEGEFYYVE